MIISIPNDEYYILQQFHNNYICNQKINATRFLACYFVPKRQLLMPLDKLAPSEEE